MSELLLILPLVLPLATAATALLAWRLRAVQQRLAVAGAAALFAAALALLAQVSRKGVQSLQVGDWPAPFGITLVADSFSAVMVTLSGLIGLLIVIYSLSSIDARRQAFGYYPLLHALLMGVCGAFLTGDLFNLYVWFEVLLMASFALMALGGERNQLEGTLKYFALSLVSSVLFLVATGLLYGVVGTLNLADLAVKLRGVQPPGLLLTLAVLYLLAFGIKAAIFPLFFWLPASYHTPPLPVTALFSALLTKVGVYALIRVFTLVFVQDLGYTHTLLLTLAGLTMVTGVLGAVAQTELRRLLSFHIVSQIGYLLMGLGLATPLALAGTIAFMVHVILSKTALFLIGGVVERLRGTSDLKKLGGLYRSQLGLSLLFLLPALSLAGLPPLSGFFAKLSLVKAGLEAGHYGIVAVALGVSLLTLFSMTKIWNEVFWKPWLGAPEDTPLNEWSRADWTMTLPAAALALLTLALGLAAGPVFDLASDAARQLLEPAGYIEAVLGGGI